jgi:hypothetical protein
VDNIHIDRVGQTLGKTPSLYPDPANMHPPSVSDAAVQIDFADILNQARQTDETNVDAVQKARGLLMTGQLTSPENIRAAAESIITSGI